MWSFVSERQEDIISCCSMQWWSTFVTSTTDTINADIFYDFVRGELLPNMNPFDGSSSKCIAVMDNCAVHHVPIVEDIFTNAGVLLIWLPPYSPNLNTIEEAFSSVKAYLKQHHQWHLAAHICWPCTYSSCSLSSNNKTTFAMDGYHTQDIASFKKTVHYTEFWLLFVCYTTPSTDYFCFTILSTDYLHVFYIPLFHVDKELTFFYASSCSSLDRSATLAWRAS